MVEVLRFKVAVVVFAGHRMIKAFVEVYVKVRNLNMRVFCRVGLY